MSFISKLFGKDKLPQTVKYDVSKIESAVSLQSMNPSTGNDGEVVAAIMAALMNILSGENNGELRIRSIRRVGRNSPVWNVAGRDEYIVSKL